MKDDLQKSDSCGLKSERKKILTSSTCSLACLSSNLGAFCPMVVHLPSEKLILPYFSGPRGVAISVPFPEVLIRKGTESGLAFSGQQMVPSTIKFSWIQKPLIFTIIRLDPYRRKPCPWWHSISSDDVSFLEKVGSSASFFVSLVGQKKMLSIRIQVYNSIVHWGEVRDCVLQDECD